MARRSMTAAGHGAGGTANGSGATGTAPGLMRGLARALGKGPVRGLGLRPRRTQGKLAANGTPVPMEAPEEDPEEGDLEAVETGLPPLDEGETGDRELEATGDGEGDQDDEDAEDELGDLEGTLEVVALDDAAGEDVAGLPVPGAPGDELLEAGGAARPPGANAADSHVDSLIADLESGKRPMSRAAAHASARRRLEDYLDRKRMARDLEDFEDFEV